MELHYSISMEDTKPQEFRCENYGTDGRIIVFVNVTGRAVKLTSRLQIERYPHHCWSSWTFCLPFSSIRWRFHGESDNSPPGLHFFLVLPEPYALAVNNTYRWTASYLDTRENEEIMFQDQTAFEKCGPLNLRDLPAIPPGGIKTILLTRKDKMIAPLRSLAMDSVVFDPNIRSRDDDEDLLDLKEKNVLPAQLVESLISLKRDHRMFWRHYIHPCTRCQEMHV